MTIGERLKRARKRLDKRQQDIADELGVAQGTVASWETGDSVPSTSKILDVAQAYGISPLNLLPRRA